MSYEANAHEVQMKILRRLLFVSSANYADIQKQTDLSSDHFNFHIKKLIEVGYVRKLDDGTYGLTQAGKEYANRMDTDEKIIEKQPKLAVLLIVENEKGEFLAQQRLKQPYFGYWARPTGKIRWGEELFETGARELMEETGLTADFRFCGIMHKMDYRKDDDSLLEDKFFYMLHVTNLKGELLEHVEGHRNKFMTEEDLKREEKVFGSMHETVEIAKSDQIEFIEEKHYYSPDDY